MCNSFIFTYLCWHGFSMHYPASRPDVQLLLLHLQVFGWTRVAELINGRVAMLGFVIGAVSEILTQNSLLAQLADHPRVRGWPLFDMYCSRSQLQQPSITCNLHAPVTQNLHPHLPRCKFTGPF
jgi:hypothetical protein